MIQPQPQPRVGHSYVAHLDDYAARIALSVFDAFAAKVTREGTCLHPHVVEVRNYIADAVTRANTRVDASTEVPTGATALALNPNAVVDTATAAIRLGITDDGVRWACRKGRLDATKVGRQWWVTTGSIDQYLARENATS